MLSQYLLIEGINLYDNMLDTDQLSIIRGTSFLYKHTVENISSHFEDDLIPISTGASSGLFLIKNDVSVTALMDSLNKFLQTPPYHLLPFAIESCVAGTCRQAKTQLTAQLRLHQLQQLTIKPDISDTGTPLSNLPCELTGYRIRAKNSSLKVQTGVQKPDRYVCASANTRYQYGREARHDFYSSLVSSCTAEKLRKDYDFCADIEALALDPSGISAEQSGRKVYPKLSDKIALIYIDGNQFGRRQRDYVENFDLSTMGSTDPLNAIPDAAAQRHFDQRLQAVRNGFLDSAIKWLMEDERRTGFAPLEGQKKLLRLETLQWGGDETLIVLPAWHGMAFIQHFFSWDWSFDGLETPLTHAAGVVFCHSKAPIRIIQRIARSLAENIKTQANGRRVDRWDYMVLESIDYPTRDDVNSYFMQRYGMHLGKRRNCNNLNLPGLPPAHDWSAAIQRETDNLINGDDIAKRQLYHIHKTLRTSFSEIGEQNQRWSDYFKSTDEPINQLSKAESRLIQVSENSLWLEREFPDLVNRLFGLNMQDINERCWVWLHLMELWNYLAPLADGVNSFAPSEEVV